MRPIDADELYRETEKKIKANNEYGRAVVDGEFLDLINDAFTEDVVPREELQRIKQETAREIFEVIDTLGTYNPTLYAELKKKYTEDGK